MEEQHGCQKKTPRRSGASNYRGSESFGYGFFPAGFLVSVFFAPVSVIAPEPIAPAGAAAVEVAEPIAPVSVVDIVPAVLVVVSVVAAELVVAALELVSLAAAGRAGAGVLG